MTTTIDTLSRIAINHAALLGPFIGLALFLVACRHLGRWPDLWRFRRAVLPHVARLGAGDYPAVDDAVNVDLEESIPEKTSLPLQGRELVGTIDAAPAEVREEFRSMERVWPGTLASIQYDVVDGERVWEVGSYAYRPQGFFGVWQYHVRLTPTGDGRTRLWAHYERSPWRQPVRHYRGDGWDAEAGVREIESLFASDERFEPSERAVELIDSSR